MSDRFYVTTPIYYVNDAPHIGHAYTTVIADALARWHRLLGDDVYFLTGTDEHGLKVAAGGRGSRAARPQEHADRTSARFREAWDLLDISLRRLHPHHRAPPPPRRCRRSCRRVYDNGHIDQDTYEGLYCVSCEAYYTEADADRRGRSAPSTRAPVEHARGGELLLPAVGVRSSRLLDWYEAHPDAVAPGGQAQRGAGLHPPGPRRHLHQPHVASTGASRCRGTPGTSSTSGTTRSSTTPPPSATARPRAVRALVAGGAPPHRQGHPPLPLRLLAGHAAGRRHRAAAPRQRARLPAGRRREDEQDRACNQIVPGRPRRRLRRRRLPLPLPARHALRARRRLQLRGAWSPATTPTSPTTSATCWHGWPPSSARSAAASGPRRGPTARWPRSPPRSTPTPPRPGRPCSRRSRLEATWRLIRETNALPRGERAVEGRPGPDGRRRAGRRPRGAADRRRARLARECPSTAEELWRRIGLPGQPVDQRLPEAAAWGGYPGGVRGRRRASRCSPGSPRPSAEAPRGRPALDRQPLPPATAAMRPMRPSSDAHEAGVDPHDHRRHRRRARRGQAIEVAAGPRRGCGPRRACTPTTPARASTASWRCSTSPRWWRWGSAGSTTTTTTRRAPAQRAAFAAQIALAHERDLALVIHTREAWDETFDILDRRGRAGPHGLPLLHRRADEARRGLDLGAGSPSAASSRSPGARDVREPPRPCARSTACWSRPTPRTWPRCPTGAARTARRWCRWWGPRWPRPRGSR